MLQIKHPGNYLRAAFPIEYLQLGKFDLPLVTSDASNLQFQMLQIYNSHSSILQFSFVRFALCVRYGPVRGCCCQNKGAHVSHS